MQVLASGAPEADRLLAQLPVVVWLIHGVHGNEISSSDAALAEAYHLLAARGPDADLTLREALVIIDPMQNPDGRQRFVTQNLLGRSLEPDAESAIGRTRRAVAGRSGQPLPVRHEPRLLRAVAARDPGARARHARLVPAGGRRPARNGWELVVLLRPAGGSDQPADDRIAAEVAGDVRPRQRGGIRPPRLRVFRPRGLRRVLPRLRGFMARLSRRRSP